MLGMWKCKKGDARPCKCRNASENGVRPLCEARAGRRLKVAGISGGRGLCARMAAMGIYPGAEMELVCAGCGAPCLVRIHGGTLSLGAGVCRKILVSPMT